MLKFNWNHTDITSKQNLKDLANLWINNKIHAAAIDTETTGLNIVLDKPFLYQFGFINTETMQGYTFVLDMENHPELIDATIKLSYTIAETAPVLLGHNIKFDLHMMTNIGYPYTKENISDTQFYIRFGHDAIAEKYGGPTLRLKKYAAQYIVRNARMHEDLLDKEKTTIANTYNKMLLSRFNNLSHTWTMGKLDELFNKNAVFDYTDLPQDLQDEYNAWRTCDLPLYLQNSIIKMVTTDDIRYDKLDRQNLITYAHYDIVYTLEIFYLLEPIVAIRQNEEGIRIENEIIYPLLEMERVGFKINKPYLQKAKHDMKDYILERRTKLYNLTGRQFKVGQHKVIKELLSELCGYTIESSEKEVLLQLQIDLQISQPDNPAIEIISVLNELRTLEKWYSTYIIRFLRNLQDADRLYTQISQVGTVTGRVTSDFQQFPKKGIAKEDGTVIFTPRDLVEVPGGDYDGLVYLDYSQIELRFQAFYTILVGHPDLNLCRAYMPYKCHIGPMQYDPTNREHIKHAYDWTWYYDEAPEKTWTPTDVHGTTTELAFDMLPDDPLFKEYRGKYGKRINFAKNYNAQLKTVWAINPKWTEEQANKVNNAYYLAFPGVKLYHQYCYDLAKSMPYAVNLFGVKYYGVSGHKLINMLIQGSAAYFLKWKIKQIYDYSHSVGLKSKFQMNIHDELSWEKHKDEMHCFTAIKALMEDWPDTQVPILADLEISETTWGQKHELKETP